MTETDMNALADLEKRYRKAAQECSSRGATLAESILDDAIAALRTVARPIGQPSGEPVAWKTVPVEPTPDMRIAGGIAWAETRDAETYVDNADACYKAMLAAVPTPSETVARETGGDNV